MKCQICSKEIDKSRYSCGIICSSECFTDWFWLDIIENKDAYIRIRGNSYILGQGSAKGFGGQHFKIEFLNGLIVDTNDLWHQGEIPEKYLSQLPDNARFI